MHKSLSIKKARKAGNLSAVRLKLWRAICAAESTMYRAVELEDMPNIIRCIHALTQSASAYSKLIEAEELCERISKLESQVTT